MTDATGTRDNATRVITWTWALLTAITVGSWWLAPAHFTGTVHASTAITALVLVLTFVKVRLILWNFMEVRTGPRWLKTSADVWLGTLFVTVFALYLA